MTALYGCERFLAGSGLLRGHPPFQQFIRCGCCHPEAMVEIALHNMTACKSGSSGDLSAQERSVVVNFCGNIPPHGMQPIAASSSALLYRVQHTDGTFAGL